MKRQGGGPNPRAMGGVISILYPAHKNKIKFFKITIYTPPLITTKQIFQKIKKISKKILEKNFTNTNFLFTYLHISFFIYNFAKTF